MIELLFNFYVKIKQVDCVSRLQDKDNSRQHV